MIASTGTRAPRSLRVLVEVNNADLRIGAANDALDLAELGRGAGAEFTICGPLTSEYEEEAARRGARTLSASSRTFSRSSLPLYAADVVRWISRLARIRPDVVHLNYPGYGPSLACAARLCRIPLVGRAGPFIADNRANRWIGSYVANCDAQARELLASPLADRVVIAGDLFRPGRVASTVALERPLPAKGEGAVRIVFLGQLVERKGLHVLIEAFARVHGNAELLLVGGDWDASGYPAHVRSLARNAGILPRVHFENHRQDIGAVLGTADIFVLPSLSEARPRSVIEAMSLGIPVAASRVGGLPSLVAHGETGLLVPPGDVARLAEALERLVQTMSLRERLGAAGRRRVEAECRPERTAAAYVAVYRRLLADAAAAMPGASAAAAVRN